MLCCCEFFTTMLSSENLLTFFIKTNDMKVKKVLRTWQGFISKKIHIFKEI